MNIDMTRCDVAIGRRHIVARRDGHGSTPTVGAIRLNSLNVSRRPPMLARALTMRVNRFAVSPWRLDKKTP